MSRLGPHRTFLLEPREEGEVKLPTDLLGINTVKYKYLTRFRIVNFGGLLPLPWTQLQLPASQLQLASSRCHRRNSIAFPLGLTAFLVASFAIRNRRNPLEIKDRDAFSSAVFS
jgi:hypothetical protein